MLALAVALVESGPHQRADDHARRERKRRPRAHQRRREAAIRQVDPVARERGLDREARAHVYAPTIADVGAVAIVERAVCGDEVSGEAALGAEGVGSASGRVTIGADGDGDVRRDLKWFLQVFERASQSSKTAESPFWSSARPVTRSCRSSSRRSSLVM